MQFIFMQCLCSHDIAAVDCNVRYFLCKKATQSRQLASTTILYFKSYLISLQKCRICTLLYLDTFSAVSFCNELMILFLMMFLFLQYRVLIFFGSHRNIFFSGAATYFYPSYDTAWNYAIQCCFCDLICIDTFDRLFTLLRGRVR